MGLEVHSGVDPREYSTTLLFLIPMWIFFVTKHKVHDIDAFVECLKEAARGLLKADTFCCVNF